MVEETDGCPRQHEPCQQDPHAKPMFLISVDILGVKLCVIARSFYLGVEDEERTSDSFPHEAIYCSLLAENKLLEIPKDVKTMIIRR